MSIVTIRIRCVVQRQLSHCWMGQTPCGEGLVVSNAFSASINVTVKEIWGITVDAFAHFWGRNTMTYIPSNPNPNPRAEPKHSLGFDTPLTEDGQTLKNME